MTVTRFPTAARRLLGAALVAGAVLVPAVALPAVTAHAATGTGLPDDPQASGYIGLCDDAGHSITEGSTTTTPFAWKAISTFRPPAAFQGPGQDAILQIYQPRPGIAPAYWSGSQLTSTGFYADSRHPTVQATYQDTSLAQYMRDYPPLVNGLYVLRMAYGKLNYGVYTTRYPTTTIQVVGTHWRVVSGGTVDCSAGSAKSNEQLTGVVSKRDVTPHPAARAAGQGAAGASSASGSGGAGSGSTAGPAATASTGVVERAPLTVKRSGTSTVAVRPAGSSDTGVLTAVALVAAGLLLLALVLWRRRVSRPAPPR